MAGSGLAQLRSLPGAETAACPSQSARHLTRTGDAGQRRASRLVKALAAGCTTMRPRSEATGRPGIHIAVTTNAGVAYEVPFQPSDLR